MERKIEEQVWNEKLVQYGEDLKENQVLGRIALEHKRMYRVWTQNGELLGEISGKLAYQAMSRADFPAVGDWVIVQLRETGKGTIVKILPRKSKFVRKVAGLQLEEQIVATNVDTIFLVQSLNDDLNLRRLERYLTLTWESGANPVIILTKAELISDVKEKIAYVESVAFGVPIVAISVFQRSGLDQIERFLLPHTTIALLGSSGVGKSTLINYLFGIDKQRVNDIRHGDDKGRHTTTHRELLLLPNGCMLIDTPGMRELQLWDSHEGLSNSFADIEKLAEQCKFKNCSHLKEIGCAVQMAIELGELAEKRWINYQKIQKELAYLEKKQKDKRKLDEKRKQRKMKKMNKY